MENSNKHFIMRSRMTWVTADRSATRVERAFVFAGLPRFDIWSPSMSLKLALHKHQLLSHWTVFLPQTLPSVHPLHSIYQPALLFCLILSESSDFPPTFCVCSLSLSLMVTIGLLPLFPRPGLGQLFPLSLWSVLTIGPTFPPRVYCVTDCSWVPFAIGMI